MLSLAGPRFTSVAKPTGSWSSKSLLGKAPPYLNSLVTIAALLKEIIDEMINNVYISIKTIYSDTIMLYEMYGLLVKLLLKM
jgi:hypothetical protein